MNRFVVVTGASTGIGRACAQHLKKVGFEVFAGVRKDSDADAVRAEGLEPLKLDVADEASVAAAREVVAARVGAAGLYGLVNNAGVAVTAPIEFVPLPELRRQLEVNVIGQVSVIQAFLPLLRTAKGRIINVSSIGGRVASPLFGPYSASKFALEAISDSLRRELRPWGIEVVVVQPGAIATPIWDKSAEVNLRTWDTLPALARELYGKLVKSTLTAAVKMGNAGTPPLKVAEVIEQALTAEPPDTRYLVGTDAKLQAALVSIVSDRVLDSLMASFGPKSG